LIEQNGTAASFFLHLAQATKDTTYRDAAHWALGAFANGFSQYGVHAAPFGLALGQMLRLE
jgi:predicted benzoate:H+ symporter BenE